jgi:hypothetical protein
MSKIAYQIKPALKKNQNINFKFLYLFSLNKDVVANDFDFPGVNIFVMGATLYPLKLRIKPAEGTRTERGCFISLLFTYIDLCLI